MKTISSTGTYELDVPVVVEEDDSDGVVSIYRPGDETLLQVSSYIREDGDQVGANDRLLRRLEHENLADVAKVLVGIRDAPDTASAIGRSEDGTTWLYVYAVWRDLTVLLTASHPEGDPRQPWIMQALSSLRRIVADEVKH